MDFPLWKSFQQHKPIRTPVNPPRQVSTSLDAQELLYHAEVCIAASRYLIDDLRYLSLHKLYQHLDRLTPQTKEIPRFLDLLQYVYISPDIQSVPQLRKMVVAYAAARMNILRQDEHFRTLMQEIAEIGADLVYEVSKAEHWSR